MHPTREKIYLQKFGDPKTSQFRQDFGQLCDLMANISGTQQDIVLLRHAFWYSCIILDYLAVEWTITA